jgi:hypothetical protein
MFKGGKWGRGRSLPDTEKLDSKFTHPKKYLAEI